MDSPNDFDYIEDLLINEKERLYQLYIQFCPVEISQWNRSFFGILRPLIFKEIKFNERYLKIIIEQWYRRKKLEKELNCHPFWIFRQSLFIKIFEEIDFDIAKDIREELS